MKRTAVVLLAAAIVTTGAVAAVAQQRAKPTKAVTAKAAKRAVIAKRVKQARKLRLKEFSRCGGFESYMRSHVADRVGPYGVYGGGFPPEDGPLPASTADRAAAAPPVSGTDYSTTNNQETDVDEADTVKTNGRTMFAISGTKLSSVDVRRGRAKLLDTLPLRGSAYGSEILMSGSRIVVLGEGRSDVVRPLPPPAGGDASASRSAVWGFYRPMTLVTLIDTSNPSDLKIIQTMTVEGSRIGARLAGKYVRLVVSSQPYGPAFVSPAAGSSGAVSQASLDAATARNKEILASSTAADWLPRMAVQNGRSGAPKRGTLLGCDDVSFPKRYSGESMLSVLTIDPAKGATPIDQDAVMTDGQLIYASSKSLYVATPRWFQKQRQTASFAPRGVATNIHRFEIVGPKTTYRAAGQVPGHLLSQFSMSEKDGVLRVASTTAPPWWGPNSRRESESYVTTLRERSGALIKAGQVRGLGKGERIYAVRFIGDAGYVVTFRQVDPLYTVDLSRPNRPRVKGELKITGYSAYLHPVGDGLLLGVGQEATPRGRRQGSQVSLFDVSDPSRPRRVSKKLLGKSWSTAEWDHHAFLYWPKTGLTMLPLITESADPSRGTYRWTARAVGLTVSGKRITSAGAVVHPTTKDGADPITRSVVVGTSVYTLSERGLGTSTLNGLRPKGFLPLGK